MYNNGNSSKNVTGASVVDGTLENADFADNQISGDKIDGGIISNFQSTGIDDRLSTVNKITLSDTTTALTTGSLTMGLSDSSATDQKFYIGKKAASGGVSTGTIRLGTYGSGSGSAITSSTNFSGTTASELTFSTTPGGSSSGTYPTERMRIDSSGNEEIGTAEATTGKLRLTGAFITNPGIDIETTQVSNGSKFASFRNSDGTQIGYISELTNSSVSYSTSSDYRLKENVTAMTGSIDRLKNLKPSRFNFIANPATTVDGFLAHEAQAVVPEAINGTKDGMTDMGNTTDAEGVILDENVVEPAELQEGQAWVKTGEVEDYQGIDQAKLVPLLVSALQEAITRIETLENA